MNEATAKHEAAHPAHGKGGHVLSPGVLLRTFGALLVLTAVTVVVSRFNFGQMNVVIALAIACTKAALVASFFMHLKYEGRFNLVLLLASVFFLIVLVSFVVFDTRAYRHDVESYQRAPPQAPATPPAE